LTDATIRAALSSAVADVLERMFFVEVFGEAPEPTVEAEAVTVQIIFDGEAQGCFQMRLARPAAHAVAADFLGEDPESLTDQQSADVTLELANMICGAVLSRIESSGTFRLGSPRIVAGDGGKDGQTEETRYTVETGSGTLTAAIQMETRTCPATERYAY